MAVDIEVVTDLDAVWPDLESLYDAQHTYHAQWYGAERQPDWAERQRKQLEDSLAAGADDVLIVIGRLDGVATGFVQSAARRDVGILQRVSVFINHGFVREGARHQGLGTRMLNRCEEWSRERGASVIEVACYVENEIGLGFWQGKGYEPSIYTLRKSITREAL